MKKWWQRYWALVRWSTWYWKQRRRAAELQPRQDRLTYAPHGTDEASQEDAAVATERRVLAALLDAGKRELP